MFARTVCNPDTGDRVDVFISHAELQFDVVLASGRKLSLAISKIKKGLYDAEVYDPTLDKVMAHYTFFDKETV
jgi:hypothetical protein